MQAAQQLESEIASDIMKLGSTKKDAEPVIKAIMLRIENQHDTLLA